MPQHNFDALKDKFPAAIQKMNDDFTSHQFILELAQWNQRLYVEALAAYDEAPFQRVHHRLSQMLAENFSHLVEHRGQANSHDIWGNPQRCASWRKKWS